MHHLISKTILLRYRARKGLRIPAATPRRCCIPARSSLRFKAVYLFFSTPSATRHSLTTKAFTELLQLLSVHVPQGASVPKSVHRLKTLFLEAFPEAKANQHFYCSCCQRPIPSTGDQVFRKWMRWWTPSGVYYHSPRTPDKKNDGRCVTCITTVTIVYLLVIEISINQSFWMDALALKFMLKQAEM